MNRLIGLKAIMDQYFYPLNTIARFKRQNIVEITSNLLGIHPIFLRRNQNQRISQGNHWRITIIPGVKYGDSGNINFLIGTEIYDFFSHPPPYSIKKAPPSLGKRGCIGEGRQDINLNRYRLDWEKLLIIYYGLHSASLHQY